MKITVPRPTVTVATPQRLVITNPTTQLLEVLTPGPRGPQGIDGAPGGLARSYPITSSHQVVVHDVQQPVAAQLQVNGEPVGAHIVQLDATTFQVDLDVDPPAATTLVVVGGGPQSGQAAAGTVRSYAITSTHEVITHDVPQPLITQLWADGRHVDARVTQLDATTIEVESMYVPVGLVLVVSGGG